MKILKECEDCGFEMVRAGTNHRYCPDCAHARKSIRASQRRFRARAAKGVELSESGVEKEVGDPFNGVDFS